jgi:hypothetical protein
VDRNVILDRIWEASESGRLITACAWCERVCIDREWVEPTHGFLDTIDQRMSLSHSICPICAASDAAARFRKP